MLLGAEKYGVKISCNISLPILLFRGIPVFARSPDVNNDEIDWYVVAVNFEMSLCCHQIDQIHQKKNEIFLRISALASEKG